MIWGKDYFHRKATKLHRYEWNGNITEERMTLRIWICTLKVLWCQFGAVFFQIVVLIQLLSFSTETILFWYLTLRVPTFFFLFNQNKSQSSQILKCCLNTCRHARTLSKLKILNQANGWCKTEKVNRIMNLNRHLMPAFGISVQQTQIHEMLKKIISTDTNPGGFQLNYEHCPSEKKWGLLWITKCLLSLLNHMDGVYFADQGRFLKKCKNKK